MAKNQQGAGGELAAFADAARAYVKSGEVGSNDQVTWGDLIHVIDSENAGRNPDNSKKKAAK
jgi:hypothetical protein